MSDIDERSNEYLDGYTHQSVANLDDTLSSLLTQSMLTRSMSAVQAHQLSPAALAYLGDAVYELYVRRHYLIPPKRPQIYHQQVVAQVTAERQACHLQSLIPYLTDTEFEILKRGRNAATGHPKRVKAVVYQQATSFEALIGYLYLTDLTRLAQLLAQLELDHASAL